MVMLVNAKCFPISTTLSLCLQRSYDVCRSMCSYYDGTTSIRFYYVVTRYLTRRLTATLLLRNCEHVQNLTTSLLEGLTTLLPSSSSFIPRSSGSHYARSHFFRERSKDVVETFPGVPGVDDIVSGTKD